MKFQFVCSVLFAASSRDSMVIGLAVTVGLLSALIITEVVLLIVFCFGKRR